MTDVSENDPKPKKRLEMNLSTGTDVFYPVVDIAPEPGMYATAEFKGNIDGKVVVGGPFFNEEEPWATRKTDMDACGRAIHVCLQTARTLTTIIAPFLPSTADKCAKMLNLGDDWQHWPLATGDLAAGHALDKPEILIKKLDAKELFGD